MAKGIPTRYEAITYTKPGTICGGSVVNGACQGSNFGPATFIHLAVSGGDVMVGEFYNPHASLSLLVLIDTVDGSAAADLPATAKVIMSIAPGKREPFVVGSGWYLMAYYNDATGGSFTTVYQGATLTQVNGI